MKISTFVRHMEAMAKTDPEHRFKLTASTVLAHLAEARDAALEEAAKLAEQMGRGEGLVPAEGWTDGYNQGALDSARIIRALKSKGGGG